MTKQYYTNPLIALWMLENFDVKVDWVHNKGNGKKVRQSASNLKHDIYHSSAWDGTYFITEDSYSIFEPVKGDMDSEGSYYDGGQWIGSCGVMEDSTTAFRNGKHFFHFKDKH